MSELETERQKENKLETERELARKLLQRCSDMKATAVVYGKPLFICRVYVCTRITGNVIVTDTNKENNVNIQNLSAGVTPSTLNDQGHSMCSNKTNSQNESTLQSSVNKTSSVSIILRKKRSIEMMPSWSFIFRSSSSQTR